MQAKSTARIAGSALRRKQREKMKIDVAKVLKDKGIRHAPGFVVRYLRRIVHEDEVNGYLRDLGHLPTLEFVSAFLKRMDISCRTEGMERLDPHGRYIFASNHPFGGLDGMMLADVVAKYFGDVRVVVNDILMNIEPLRPIFVPVNKHGRQNPEYSRLFAEAFESDVPIVTFPAGLCSRRIRGRVTDLPWKPNFIRRAIAERRDVVPVFFEGELSNFFYRLSNIRKMLGVKANIEMLYLVDEMFRQSGRSFTIRIGEPVPWQQIADGQRPQAWCDEIRRRAEIL